MTSITGPAKVAASFGLSYRASALAWFRRGLFLPLLVLVASLAATYWLWKSAASSSRQELQSYFDYRVHDTNNRIRQRLLAYETILRGLQGFFDGSDHVERDDFRRYVAALQLAKNYEGIHGLGFTLIVPAAEKAKHIAAVRKEGFPGYTIWPEGPRDTYTTIIYREPLYGRGQIALGYDMTCEPIRRAAMEQARDFGLTVASGKLQLVYDSDQDAQPGFIMYAPVYKTGAPHNTIAERRASIAGWVYASFHVSDLMARLQNGRGSDLDLEIYDGEVASKATLMYDSEPSQDARSGASRFRAVDRLDVGGHTWTVFISPAAAFPVRLGEQRSDTVKNAGLAGSALLTLLTWLLVTGRERAIRMADERETRFKHLMQQANESILLIGLDGRILDVNKRALQHFGYTTSELQKMTVEELHEPDTTGPVMKKLEASQTSGGARFETQVRRKDGSICPVEIGGTVVNFGNECLVLAFVQDITERRRTEAALRASEERWKFALEGAGHGVWDWNVQTGESLYSARNKEILGYSENEMANHHSAWEQRLHPEDKERVLAFLQAYVDGKAESYSQEYRLLCKAGGWKWVLSRGMVLSRAADGKPVRLIGTITDISYIKQVEAEMTKAKELAESANRAKSEFLANMSHEIRTPLNGVIPMADFLLEANLGEREREFARAIKSSAESLLTVINDILDFSKIEANRLELEMIDFEVKRTIDQVADMLGLRAQRKGVELICHVDPGVPRILGGDPGRLLQVLVNLVGNAVKFTSAGEVVVLVHALHLDQRQATLRFEVRDTGLGIPAEQIGNLFTAFTQADASTTRRFGGTGLGLSISKRLVELMGGKIGAESKEHVGSTFWFTASFQYDPENASAGPPLPETVLQDCRVLVADDNLTQRGLLMSLLKSWGCHPTAVADGPAALAELRQSASSGDCFAIALLDKSMPGMDGEALGGLIRDDVRLAATRCVLLTSALMRSCAEGRRPRGFDAWLAKPLREDQLRSCLIAMRTGGTFAAQAPPPVTRSMSTESTRGVRILLVEDNYTNQQVAYTLLANHGYQVDMVEDGRQALEALKTNSYHLVLMDCLMPVMDGFEATRRLRRGDPPVLDPGVPVIAMTASAMRGDRERCLQAGMNDFVTKPIVQAELLSAMARALGMGNAVQSESRSPVRPAPGDAEIQAFDVDNMLHNFSGNRKIALVMLKQLLSDMPARLSALQAALATGDADTATREAHTIKGLAAGAGALPLRDVACDVEKLCRQTLLDQATQRLPALAGHVEQVTPQWRAFLSAGL